MDLIRGGKGARGISATPGICGGNARITGTRIPVSLLVQARRLGASDEELLGSYPRLQAGDLINAWAYAKTHRDEINQQIRDNEAA